MDGEADVKSPVEGEESGAPTDDVAQQSQAVVNTGDKEAADNCEIIESGVTLDEDKQSNDGEGEFKLFLKLCILFDTYSHKIMWLFLR